MALKQYKPCMNSNNLLTTVFRKRQWARRNRGYCPTTYMMFDAMIALLSFPRFCSHNPNSSCSNSTSKQAAWSFSKQQDYKLLRKLQWHFYRKHRNINTNVKSRVRLRHRLQLFSRTSNTNPIILMFFKILFLIFYCVLVRVTVYACWLP